MGERSPWASPEEVRGIRDAASAEEQQDPLDSGFVFGPEAERISKEVNVVTDTDIFEGDARLTEAESVALQRSISGEPVQEVTEPSPRVGPAD